MTINFATMAKIASKNSKAYKIVDVYGKEGWKNVVRNVKEKNGRFTSRVQTFDNRGNLSSTIKHVNDDSSIYSNPTNGRLCLEYFVSIKDPKAFLGRRYNKVNIITTAKDLTDVRAFYESQAHNIK